MKNKSNTEIGSEFLTPEVLEPWNYNEEKYLQHSRTPELKTYKVVGFDWSPLIELKYLNRKVHVD